MTQTITLAPVKKRRRWLKPVLVILALFLAIGGTSVSWLEWRTAQAKARFMAERAILQGVGQPVASGDLAARHAVEDEKNACLPLRRAADRIPELNASDEKAFTNLPFQLPLSDRERSLMDRVLVDSNAVLDDVRDASLRPGAHWEIERNVPLIAMLYPDIKKQNRLVFAIEIDAVCSDDKGEFTDAVRRAASLYTAARAMGHFDLVIGFLLASGYENRACLRIADTVARATESRRLVDRQMIQDLMQQLSEESAMLESVQDALRGDRVMVMESMELVVTWRMPIDGKDASLQEKASTYISRPEYWNAGTKISGEYSRAIHAAGANDWPTAITLLPTTTSRSDVHPAEGLLRIMTPSFEQVIAMHFEAVTRRRLLRTALAIHMYAADHHWKRPTELSDLVPKYLPEIPIDPMARGNRRIQYINDANKPRVYGVGQDQTDGSGEELTRRDGDLVLHLLPRPRPPDVSIEDDEERPVPNQREPVDE